LNYSEVDTLTFSRFTLLACLLVAPVYAQDVDDAAIHSRVGNAIENSDELDGANIHVTSVNGYVLLTGQVLSADQKQQASVAVAFATRAMRRLINEVEVVDSIDDGFLASDATLKTNIEEAIKNLTHRTTVVVHNGSVHLLGQVSRSEGNAVAQKASTISGVKTIRLSFEFTD
jgi:osmotically-inducible protein OsmY